MTGLRGHVLCVTKGLDLGGMERVVTDLAIGLCRRGVDIRVALINPGRDRLVPALNEAGVAVHPLGGTDRLGWRALVRLRRLIRADRPALVHAHGPMAGLAAALATPRRTPVLVSLHTTWQAMNRATRAAVYVLQPGRGPLITVSAAVRASLPNRLRVRAIDIGHGVDNAACAAAEQARPAAQATRVCSVVAVASHRPVKNHETLLRACAAARADGAALRLLLVGDGPRLEAHRHLADALGLGDVVTFRPPHPAVLLDIAAADVFVIASDLEGQPLVLLEAMATGRAVVATTVGRATELLDDTCGRLVPPGDVAALAAALCELAADGELRTRLGAAARVAIAPHSLSRAIDHHLAVYEGALA